MNLPVGIHSLHIDEFFRRIICQGLDALKDLVKELLREIVHMIN